MKEKGAERANNEKTNKNKTYHRWILDTYILYDLTRIQCTQWISPKTNTSQLNQHARVQRKYCKLMTMETSE